MHSDNNDPRPEPVARGRLSARGALRRRLALGIAGLSAVPAGLLWWRQRPSPTVESMFTLVAERLLPATADNPGAVAMGLVPRTLAGLDRDGDDQAWGPELLQALEELAAAKFHTMDDAGRDAWLEPVIGGRVAGTAAVVIQRFFARLVQAYYSREESWAAIAYRKPQPGGYPEYAACGAKLGSTG